MNISTNFTTPAFKGFYVQDDKMNQRQRNLSSEILDSITYSDAYLESDDKNIDVYITPDYKNKKAVNVRYMDMDNGYYFRNGDRRIVQTKVFSGHALSSADAIISQLKDILSGKYKFRDFDAFIHENKNSDLYKVRPEYIENLAKIIKKCPL
ncbi:MAG: hypothetical protein NC191_06365 [Muribaculaceae bacterium]|nr:hypothetical protein [Muribaculaceae bacterium]